MADVSIRYKNTEIGSMSATGTKTVNTAGKYCEDNITIAYVQPGASPDFQSFNLTITDDRTTSYIGSIDPVYGYTYNSSTNYIQMAQVQPTVTGSGNSYTWSGIPVPAIGSSPMTYMKVPWVAFLLGYSTLNMNKNFDISATTNCVATKYKTYSDDWVLLVSPTTNGANASVTLSDVTEILPASGVSF